MTRLLTRLIPLIPVLLPSAVIRVSPVTLRNRRRKESRWLTSLETSTGHRSDRCARPAMEVKRFGRIRARRDRGPRATGSRVAKLTPAPEARVRRSASSTCTRPLRRTGLVRRARGLQARPTEVTRKCWGCYKACTPLPGEHRGPRRAGPRYIRLPTIFSNSPRTRIRLRPSSSAQTCCSSRWSGISNHHAGDHPRLLPSGRDGPYQGMLGLHRPPPARSRDSNSPQQPYRYLSVTTR